MIEGLIVAVSVLCAARFLADVRQPPTAYRTFLKTVSTASLALFVLYVHGATLLSLSLGLGALGDYFLATTNTDANFLRGLSSFLLAHLIYIKILWNRSSGAELLLSSSFRLTLLPAVALVALGLNYLMFTRVSTGMRTAIAIYTVVIFAMLVSSLCIENTWVISGAILFTLSDGFLATDRFLLPRGSKHAPWMQCAVWILYYTGQLLLALGLSSRV